MKTLVAGVLALLLAGCATERYYPVYQSEGDGYYIAERSPAAGGYGAAYDSLFALGVYPWWVHTFHTPYYYPYYFTYYHPFYDPYYGPYHFSGWYPAWPYYGGYPARHSWGWPPYHAYRHAPQRVTAPVSAERRSRAVAPSAPPAAGPNTFLPADPRPATPYSGRLPEGPPGQPAAPLGQPMAPAAIGRPFPSEPARGYRTPSERGPAERDQ